MTHLVVRNSDGECARTPPTPPMQVRVHAPPLPANARAYASAMRVHLVHGAVQLFARDSWVLISTYAIYLNILLHEVQNDYSNCKTQRRPPTDYLSR
jgi:hypothetical protein